MKNTTDFSIRRCRELDYDDLYGIWQKTGITLGLSDTRQEFLRFIRRNEDLCFIASREQETVGCVLGSFDGRRGLVHHLAVDPGWQGKGIGEALMRALEARFREMRVVKINFWVEADNRDVVDFYVKIGYEVRDLITLSKTLR